MVTYNNLMKDYKIKLDDLTPKEVMSLLESLIKKMYDAYAVYDMELMEKYHNEIEETISILDSKFNNIMPYVWRTKLFYESSLSQYRLRKYILNERFQDLESYVHLYGKLESDFFHLCSILSTYYFNYSNNNIDAIIGYLSIEHNMEEICDKNIDEELWNNFGINYFLMKNLDCFVADVRDSILETINIIDKKYYSHNTSEGILNESILNVKNHVHDLIKEDCYRYQRERGIIDVELGWIDVYRIEHDLNKAYEGNVKYFVG